MFSMFYGWLMLQNNDQLVVKYIQKYFHLFADGINVFAISCFCLWIKTICHMESNHIKMFLFYTF